MQPPPSTAVAPAYAQYKQDIFFLLDNAKTAVQTSGLSGPAAASIVDPLERARATVNKFWEESEKKTASLLHDLGNATSERDSLRSSVPELKAKISQLE